MSAFPLLNVPAKALENIMDQFNLMQLSALSQCSKKALEVVKKASASRKLLVLLDVQATKVVTLGEVKGRDTLKDMVCWEFYGKRDIRRQNMANLESHSLNGQDVEVARDQRHSKFQCRTGFSLEQVLRFAEHVSTEFSAPVTCIAFHSEDGVLETLQSFRFFRNIREVVLYNKETPLRHSSPLVTHELGHEEMRQILDGFDELDDISLFCGPGADFVYDKPIASKRVWIQEGMWLKRGNLLNLDCERAELEGCRLKDEDFNAFLRQWLNGKDTKLEYLHIQSKHQEDVLDVSKILDGIPVMPGWPKYASATRYPYSARFHEGYDLRRESDGMLGTVLITGHWAKDTFLFVAWHVSDPNYPFRRIMQR